MSRTSHPPDNAHARSLRRGKRAQQRRIAAAVLVAIALVGAAFLVDSRTSSSSRTAAVTSPTPAPRPSKLLLFGVSTGQPHTAIVGTGGGRLTTAAALPFNLLTTIPGAGTGTVSSAMRESPDFGRTAVSNLLGVWVPHYVVVDPETLSGMVDARGGLLVNLPRAISVADATLGPGPTQMDGAQVVAYLEEGVGGDRNTRWERVLVPLFRGPVKVPPAAVTDDREAAMAQLAAARGAVVSEFPTQAAEGGYRSSEANLTTTTLAEIFGIEQASPVPVVLLSGVDRPLLAERATADLVPAGFQIAAYQDARGIDRHPRPNTSIFATQEGLADADRVARALGVGKVFLSRQGSGFADITVIVGKDYLAGIE